MTINYDENVVSFDSAFAAGDVWRKESEAYLDAEESEMQSGACEMFRFIPSAAKMDIDEV